MPYGIDLWERQSYHKSKKKKNKLVLLFHWSVGSIIVILLLSHVLLFATPWSAAPQASLSFTTSQSLLKLMPIESVMPSNYLILCHPLLLMPSNLPKHQSTQDSALRKFSWIILFSPLTIPPCPTLRPSK